VPAPTIGTPLGSVYNTTADPKTAGPFTLAVGDFLVVLAVFENNPATTLVPAITTTGTAALTFTKAQEVTTSTRAVSIVYYSQTVTAAGSYTCQRASRPRTSSTTALTRGRHRLGRGRRVELRRPAAGTTGAVADVVGGRRELGDLHGRRRLGRQRRSRAART
jgi:hypothetical protein